MKYFICALLFAGFLSTQQAKAQGGLRGLIKKATTRDSVTGKTGLGSVFSSITSGKGNLSTDEVVNGLKEALTVGTQRSTGKLSVLDGYFSNQFIKILLPPEARKVESALRTVGMGKLVDDAILSMNRAAEDAAKSAAPIFVNAVRTMTIQDGWNILRGNNQAATQYLQTKTSMALTDAFRPIIQQSLSKVNATQYWQKVFNAYNKISFQKVNPDLTAYVTDKALAGMFYQVGQEEIQIRQNPLARTTDLLKKVFSN
ncbi:MAG: hypothetical protein JWN76_1542 [Chitinophagaceae bacterium]|nr:hypothetical protein [Chitinophagaceae bacterium]